MCREHTPMEIPIDFDRITRLFETALTEGRRFL
jgi:hypothetical protein